MQLFSLLNNIVHGKQNAGFFLSIWYIISVPLKWDELNN